MEYVKWFLMGIGSAWVGHVLWMLFDSLYKYV